MRTLLFLVLLAIGGCKESSPSGGDGGGDTTQGSPSGGGGGHDITNNPPTATAFQVFQVGSTVTQARLSAFDADGDILTYAVVTSPLYGTLTLDTATGIVTYTPRQPILDHNDSFTFKVSDGKVESDIALVTLTLTEVFHSSQKIQASVPAVDAYFGQTVAVSGTVAIIGAPSDSELATYAGAAYIFRYNGTTWLQEKKLMASDGTASDSFGFGVAISGNVALIGASGDNGSGLYTGSAYFFRYNGTTWVQEQKVTASDMAANSNFGLRVSLDGNVAVIGTFQYSPEKGAAYVFRCAGTIWTQEKKLVASDGSTGDIFGNSVAVQGAVIAVGALRYGSNSGATYIFRYASGDWSEEAKLIPSSAVSNYFGEFVALSGSVLVIGARGGPSQPGSAYVFRNSGAFWSEEQRLYASDGANHDLFGVGVAVLGDRILVGARGNDTFGTDAGAAYYFRYRGSSWTEDQKLQAIAPAFTDLFGSSVALSSDTAWVAAVQDDDGASNAGTVQLFFY